MKAMFFLLVFLMASPVMAWEVEGETYGYCYEYGQQDFLYVIHHQEEENQTYFSIFSRYGSDSLFERRQKISAELITYDERVVKVNANVYEFAVGRNTSGHGAHGVILVSGSGSVLTSCVFYEHELNY